MESDSSLVMSLPIFLSTMVQNLIPKESMSVLLLRVAQSTMKSVSTRTAYFIHDP